MIIVYQQSASALLDPSSIFSYMLEDYGSRLGMSPKPLSSQVLVSTLVGDLLIIDQVCRGYIVTFRTLILGLI